MRWPGADTTCPSSCRPDTHTPARDPFEYYGLTRYADWSVEHAPASGPALARRVGYLAFAAGARGRRRATRTS